MDSLSMAGPTRNVVVVGSGKSELDAYIDRGVARQGRVISPEPTPEKGYYYRSDHFALARKGVPMMYFEGADDLVEGGKAAGKAAADDYTNNRYHSPKDEFDPNWDWSGIEQDLELFYVVGRELAMSAEWPNWVEGDEFRAARDKSRQGAQ
jgi:Zn-dependent M28 family amino/carboxypeptidase